MAQPEILPLIALVWIQVVFVTMVYGPIAAFLVEFFPAKIRYTSLSIPYHIGNGWFGGFLPLIAAALLASTGNLYAGLIYPIVVAIMTVIIGGLFIRETRHVKIWDEVGGETSNVREAAGEIVRPARWRSSMSSAGRPRLTAPPARGRSGRSALRYHRPIMRFVRRHVRDDRRSAARRRARCGDRRS